MGFTSCRFLIIYDGWWWDPPTILLTSTRATTKIIVIMAIMDVENIMLLIILLLRMIISSPPPPHRLGQSFRLPSPRRWHTAVAVVVWQSAFQWAKGDPRHHLKPGLALADTCSSVIQRHLFLRLISLSTLLPKRPDLSLHPARLVTQLTSTLSIQWLQCLSSFRGLKGIGI